MPGSVRSCPLGYGAMPMELTRRRHRHIKRNHLIAIEGRETAGLIGSDKVEGTTVYDTHGEMMSSIEGVMIERRSSQVAYAVLSFGSFPGIGSDSYPMPLASLSYDTSLGSYLTTLTEEQLQGAPKYGGNDWDWEVASGAERSTSITARMEKILMACWLAGCQQGTSPAYPEGCPALMGLAKGSCSMFHATDEGFDSWRHSDYR